MKTPFLFILSLLFISDSLCQTSENANSFYDATICDKTAVDEKSGILFTPFEIQNCDLKINMIDEDYVVSFFKLTIVPKDVSSNLEEYEINGNAISENIQTQILERAKSVYLEYIKAKNSNGEIVHVRPIKIIVKS